MRCHQKMSKTTTKTMLPKQDQHQYALNMIKQQNFDSQIFFIKFIFDYKDSLKKNILIGFFEVVGIEQ